MFKGGEVYCRKVSDLVRYGIDPKGGKDPPEGGLVTQRAGDSSGWG